MTLNRPKERATCRRQRRQYALTVFGTSTDHSQAERAEFVGEGLDVEVVIVGTQYQWPPDLRQCARLLGYRVLLDEQRLSEGILKFACSAGTQLSNGAIGALDEVLGLRVGIERRHIRNPSGMFESSNQPGPVRAVRPAHADADEWHQPAGLVRSDQAR